MAEVIGMAGGPAFEAGLIFRAGGPAFETVVNFRVPHLSRCVTGGAFDFSVSIKVFIVDTSAALSARLHGAARRHDDQLQFSHQPQLHERVYV